MLQLEMDLVFKKFTSKQHKKFMNFRTLIKKLLIRLKMIGLNMPKQKLLETIK